MTDVETQPGSPQHLGQLKAWPLKIKIVAGVLTAIIGVGSTATVAAIKIGRAKHDDGGGRATTVPVSPPGPGPSSGDASESGRAVNAPTSEVGVALNDVLDSECNAAQLLLEQASAIPDTVTALDNLGSVASALADDLEALDTGVPAVIGASAALRDAADSYVYAAQMLVVGETSTAQQASATASVGVATALQALADLGAPACTP